MTLGGHRDVITSRSHLRIPLELAPVTLPRHLSITAEHSHVSVLLPVQILVLPGLVSSVPLLATGAYRPRHFISGEVCYFLLEEAPCFPVQAVL